MIDNNRGRKKMNIEASYLLYTFGNQRLRVFVVCVPRPQQTRLKFVVAETGPDTSRRRKNLSLSRSIEGGTNLALAHRCQGSIPPCCITTDNNNSIASL